MGDHFQIVQQIIRYVASNLRIKQIKHRKKVQIIWLMVKRAVNRFGKENRQPNHDWGHRNLMTFWVFSPPQNNTVDWVKMDSCVCAICLCVYVCGFSYSLRYNNREFELTRQATGPYTSHYTYFSHSIIKHPNSNDDGVNSSSGSTVESMNTATQQHQRAEKNDQLI